MNSSLRNSSLRMIGALGLGAATMYLLDPERGRTRRALVRDKTRRITNWSELHGGKAGRDLANRARGLWHDVTSIFESEDVTDEQLSQRLRTQLGRITSHPRAIDVECAEGVVTLRGPILESEVDDVIAGVEAVRGVENVRNELEVHAWADIASLQDGQASAEDEADSTWSPATRLLVGTAGGALAIAGALKYARPRTERTSKTRGASRRRS